MKESFAKLTRREKEVLHLVTQGLTNREIAVHLSLSVYTVETYLRVIYAKLGARGRAQAAAWYAKHDTEG